MQALLSPYSPAIRDDDTRVRLMLPAAPAAPVATDPAQTRRCLTRHADKRDAVHADVAAIPLFFARGRYILSSSPATCLQVVGQ